MAKAKIEEGQNAYKGRLFKKSERHSRHEDKSKEKAKGRKEVFKTLQ